MRKFKDREFECEDDPGSRLSLGESYKRPGSAFIVAEGGGAWLSRKDTRRLRDALTALLKRGAK